MSRAKARANTASAPDLAGFFAARGYQPSDTPEILQPTGDFLDHASRDLRRHFYMLRDLEGRSFFLRPDFTLPLAAAYARKPQAKQVFYVGPVFRFDAEKSQPVRREQAGIEWLGEKNAVRADSEIVALTRDALQHIAPASKITLHLGDAGLFAAFMESLGIPLPLRERFQQFFRRRPAGSNPVAPASSLPDISQPPPPAHLPRTAAALARFWQQHNIPPISQRSAEEIAARLASLDDASGALNDDQRRLAEKFFQLDAPSSKAVEKIAAFAARAGVALDAPLAQLDKRLARLAASGFDLDASRFATRFAGAGLGYYTGFTFAFFRRQTLIAAGGRYDGLLKALGVAQDKASGAGVAIYLDALERRRGQEEPKVFPASRRRPLRSARLTLALPSKGRIGDSAQAFLAARGLKVSRHNHTRALHGKIAGLENVDVVFLPAAEIAHQLVQGHINLGITGADLVRETAPGILKPRRLAGLPFAHARLVIAVPQCWIDVERLEDLDAAAQDFRRRHGRRLRIATKYPRLARAFFSREGLIAYRLVESLGATESAPTQLVAEAIIDITETGASLQANGLKPLRSAEGEVLSILATSAGLYVSPRAPWSKDFRQSAGALLAKTFQSSEITGALP